MKNHNDVEEVSKDNSNKKIWTIKYFKIMITKERIMETILRFDGIEFSISAENSFENIINEYFISTDDKSNIYRRINIHYGGVCGSNDYKTNSLLLTLKNFMDVEYKIYKENTNNIINYVCENSLYGRHVYRKITENHFEVYSIDKSEINGMQWVIRLIREILLENNIEEGYVPVHSSGIDINGEAVLFIGNKGSGKTTSMFACATNEQRKIISNDLVFLKVDNEKINVKGWPWCVTIGNELMAETKYKDLINNQTSKVRLSPKEFRDYLNCDWTWKSVLKKVVFPKIIVGKNIEIKEIDKETVKSRLINEGTKFSDITLLFKSKTVECNFLEPFASVAYSKSGFMIEGDFWKYREEFFSFM